MAEFSAFDANIMAHALRLAEKGIFLARPNPRVGCVIVKDEQIIGEGFHQAFGEAHAEVNALRQAGDGAKGATAYVTLEPCAHHGKTPPCAQALIDAGISEVICAMRDPNPRVDGGGFHMLKQAGIAVKYGLMTQEAELLNPGFIKRMTQRKPWVRVKVAISVDGRTAMASGESQWITGEQSRRDVQRLRARHDAIITGSGTLALDNPSMNVRLNELGEEFEKKAFSAFRQPVRILIDRQARANLSQRFFSIESPIWWVGDKHPDVNLPEHVERKQVPGSGKEFLSQLLTLCATNECNEVLVEAGSILAAEFIKAQLVDELIIYMAPKLMGSQARPMALLPFDTMEQALTLSLSDCRHFGDDIRLTYRFKS
ncbi:bifunctional diaminohydroxyphosphoribosylaminopyrimidine deaminase/5-amino-6-(5-phosphoribosylamino)uracil reductase RibD [Pleionea sediminis]|uniref:bifunctional diaminohydroxyphosphoribosylaminopyrimidine deaminase/5-amino-6-(5-phosphoribosylamino)uracil reductase RibD n=1 Tax=Pleionea sediminis TaxID=2569479 RepID=UPI00197C2D33|nr:bifunctional diaminohydroxyphosphoribosylaminopyrimidine deaminase/5-amino-6-(5-phosphoribosylamino)uracil reductase RibD [Pleionea sediminis]